MLIPNLDDSANISFVNLFVWSAASHHHTNLDVVAHIFCILVVTGMIAAFLEHGGQSIDFQITKATVTVTT